jgi:hypothetical protein
VVVPFEPAIIEELLTSNGLAVLPEYSAAVIQIVWEPLGVQVIVVSVPSEILYQT